MCSPCPAITAYGVVSDRDLPPSSGVQPVPIASMGGGAQGLPWPTTHDEIA